MDTQQLQATRRSPIGMKIPLLKQGDIVQGKVLTLYPEQRAQIQLGKQKMMAQLEIALTAGGKYHFYVQSTGNETRLQVLGDRLNEQIEDHATRLLRQLGLKPSKQQRALVRQLISEEIPFTKTQLADAFFLVNKAGNKEQARQTIINLLGQERPVTETVFDAMYTRRMSGFSEQLEALAFQLNENPQSTDLHQRLIERISLLIGQSPFPSKSSSAIFSEHLNHVLQFTGISGENQPGNSQQAETIKSLVLQLYHNSEGILHDQTQQILHFINGLQLDSVDETTNMIQASLQLPGGKLGLNQDLHLDFSGKNRNRKNKCRSLPHLTLS